MNTPDPNNQAPSAAAPATPSPIRYFTNGTGGLWEFENGRLWVSRRPSDFQSIEHLQRELRVYETDSHGRRLDDPSRDILSPL